MTEPILKIPPRIPSENANVRSRLAESATPRRADLANSRSFILSSIVVASSMLPVLIPGIIAFAKQDAILSLVDSHPQKGWLALLASMLVLGLQVFMTRRSTFRMSFEVLRNPALEVMACIWMCRFGWQLAMVAVTFLAVPQGEESLRTLFEHTHRYDFWYYLRAGFFHLSVILLSVGLWYSSRYLLDRFRGEYRGSSINVDFPRILGALGCLIPALALHQAPSLYQRILPSPAPSCSGPGPVLRGSAAVSGCCCWACSTWAPTSLIYGSPGDRVGIEEHAWHSLNRAALIEFFLGGFLSVFFRRPPLVRRGAGRAQPDHRGNEGHDPGTWGEADAAADPNRKACWPRPPTPFRGPGGCTDPLS